MVIDMKVIGKMIKLKEKEFFIGKTEIDMKEVGKIISKKEMVLYIIQMNLLMAIDMKENGKMGKRKEKEYTILIMAIGEWEIFLMVNLLENI